jgi:2'-5' RNA ligase
MPRLFVGLEIPREVGQALSLLRGGLPGARWADPDNYHITLRFIGDIDDRLAHDIAQLLDGVKRRSFEVRFGTLMPFGGRKPRAIVVAVEPIQPLVELQSELERLMQRLGLEPEGRKFIPHVTLARLRDVSSRDVADYLSTRGPLFGASFHVSRFVLFSARASVGGGPYVIEADYPLAA